MFRLYIKIKWTHTALPWSVCGVT